MDLDVEDGFDLKDIVESFFGAFTFVLFLLILKNDSGPFINPIYGFFVNAAIMVFYVYGMTKFYSIKNAFLHFFTAYFLAIINAIFFSLLFGLANKEQLLGSLFSLNFFGTPPVIIAWFATSGALIFDLKRIDTIFGRWL